MNDKNNEKQLMPLKRIFIYTIGIGLVLMVIAFVSGWISFGDVRSSDSVVESDKSDSLYIEPGKDTLK